MDNIKIKNEITLKNGDMTLTAPCVSVQIFLDHTTPEILLDIYYKAREALGDLLSHASIGKDFKKLTPRSETTVAAWCKDLKPWT